MTHVAFIGLGAMGRRIAGRLLDAGHNVKVWNRTPQKGVELVHRGAFAASSPAAAAAGADVVVTMVSDPQALTEVTEGAAGIASNIEAPTIVVEMSTVGPAAVQRLRAALAADVGLVDAPVLGSLAEAETGQLMIFAGGSSDDVERVRPLLSALGETLHVGRTGSGAAAKLVANSVLFGVLAVLGEAIAFGDALGLDRDTTFDVLVTTPLRAQAERRRPAVTSGTYAPRFTLALARKDADLILEAAGSANVDMRVARQAATWLVEAHLAGRGGDDYSAVMAQIIGASSTARSGDA